MTDPTAESASGRARHANRDSSHQPETTTAGSSAAVADPQIPVGFGAKLRRIGPGLIAAATGIGAGDLVATLVAGSRFGTALLWAAILGSILKLALAEAVGRWHLATGATIMDGWRRLGRWATGFFGVYILIWGFVYGATAMSATGLGLNAMVGGLSVRYWAMIAGVVGLVMIWMQRYEAFEKVMAVLVGVMFVSVIGIAALVTPDLGELATGVVPTLPDGSVIYVLGLIGGVGGTITMAAYGYWVIAKGWKGSGWLSLMRLDNTVGYVLTGVFVVAMLIVGAELLLGQDIEASDEGLLSLGTALGAEFGAWARWLFLIGFLSATFTSLLGVWHGVSLLFVDWWRSIRLPHGAAVELGAGRTGGATGAAASGTAETVTARSTATDTGYEADEVQHSTPFRFYLLWLTFPPMALLFLDRPFLLTVVYGVLGSAFMPFLAITLLLLLNSKRTAAVGRSGWLSNGLLGLNFGLFLVLLATDIANRIG